MDILFNQGSATGRAHPRYLRLGHLSAASQIFSLSGRTRPFIAPPDSGRALATDRGGGAVDIDSCLRFLRRGNSFCIKIRSRSRCLQCTCSLGSSILRLPEDSRPLRVA